MTDVRYGSTEAPYPTANYLSSWYWQNPTPTGNHLFAVCQMDDMTATAVGDNGTILRTTDGGVTWAVQRSGITTALSGVSFVNAFTGTVVGTDGVILRTTDGGLTWEAQISGTDKFLSDVHFTDELTGTAVGGAILRTTDGGNTWITLDPGYYWFGNTAVHFTDSMTGTKLSYVFGPYGTPGAFIHKTTDGGITWQQRYSESYVDLYSVYFTDAMNGTAVGSSVILRTVDGGDTWTIPSETVEGTWGGICYADSLNGTAVGSGGRILLTRDGGDTWALTSSPTINSLVDVSYANSPVGTAVGHGGTIIRTTDGGDTWTLQSSSSSNFVDHLRGVFLIDAMTGTVVGHDGVIYRTTDGGNNWLSQSSGLSTRLWDVCFRDSLTGIAVGDSGQVIRTTDGGSNWVSCQSGADSDHLLTDVDFINDTTVVVVGNQEFLRSLDGGITWIAKQVPQLVEMFGVHFTDLLMGTAVGNAGVIYRTSDGGDTWQHQSSGLVTNLKDVQFADSLRGIVVGHQGTILRTTDGGINWVSQSSGTTRDLRCIWLDQELNAWVIGNNGTVLQTFDGGITWFIQTLTESHLMSVSFADNHVGVIVGENGVILRTDSPLLPELLLDPMHHDGNDSLRVLPGASVCSHFILYPPEPGIEVAFELFGANSGNGTAYTNAQGEVSWCYSAGDVGIDGVIATAEILTPDTTFIVSGRLELTLLPYELSVNPAWHTVSDSLVILPDSMICTHFLLNPEIPDVEVEFTTSGANTITGSGVTNAAGEVECCYSPNYLGSDTITASILFPFSNPYTTQAQFERKYLSPQFYFDPAQHSGIDTLLAVPGINLCSHFITDPPVEGAQVALRVRGANHLDVPNAATTAGDGTASACYIAAQMGVDTLTATIELNYGGGVYEKSSSLVFQTVPLVFETNPDYHTDGDTVITTSPEDTVFTHFRVVPPVAGVNVLAEVTGANQSTMSAPTDEFGHVVLGYPAQQSGVDTITATSEFIIGGAPYYESASVELIIIGGGTIVPVTALSVGLDPSENKILVSLTSNKELDSPTAEFEFERIPGSPIRSTKSLHVDSDEWIYSTSFDIFYSGHLNVHIIASDLFGYDVSESRSYDIAKVIRVEEMDFRSNDGKVGFYAPFGYINKTGSILIERASGWEGSVTDDSGSPLIPASQRFHLSTNSVLLGDPSLIIWHTYQAAMLPGEDLRRVGIYRQSGSVWTYTGGQGDAETASAGVEIPGVYAAFYNDSYYVVPTVTQLHQNFPNPFKVNTTIAFDLNANGNALLTIHDVTGRRIRTLKNGPFPMGAHRAEWNGRSDAGETVASGVYFYRLKTGSFTSTKKMVLLR
jgi:photosystem II stability/assembly factor-like uncharacterized protein